MTSQPGFNILNGGNLAGTYTIPPFANCGLVTGLLNLTILGPATPSRSRSARRTAADHSTFAAVRVPGRVPGLQSRQYGRSEYSQEKRNMAAANLRAQPAKAASLSVT